MEQTFDYYMPRVEQVSIELSDKTFLALYTRLKFTAVIHYSNLQLQLNNIN